MSSMNASAEGDFPSAFRRHAVILFGLNALYVGFGMIIGVVNGGLPTVMRAQGIDISTAGWLYLLYLPFGLTFLWAPAIDRLRLPFLSRRVGWIVSMQTLAVLGLMVVAFNEGLAPLALFVMGLGIVFAIATMDIALDALAVKLVAADWRPSASATKLAALSAGSMIGGGAFVALADDLGWQLTFLILSAVLVVLLFPVLSLRRFDRHDKPGAEQTKGISGGASLLRLLRDGPSRNRLIILCIACGVMFPLVGLNRLMLVDIGVPVSEIGWIVGTLGPVAMLATSAVSIPMMRYLGLVRAMLIFAVIAVAALVAMLVGYVIEHQLIAIIGAVAIGAGVSGVYVTIAAKILGWSVGMQPATDYAAYYGISRFVSTLMTVGATQIVPLMTWGLFYGAGAVAFLVMVFLLIVLFGRND